MSTPGRIASWIIKDRTGLNRYGSAVAWSVIALILILLVHPVTDRNLFFVSLVSIVSAAVFCGAPPALLATGISIFGLNFFLMSDGRALRLESGEDLARIGIFVVASSFLTAIGAALRASLIEAQKARLTAEEATKARDEFISIVSHELKGPLTALGLRVQLGLRNVRQNSGRSIDYSEAYSNLLRASDVALGRFQRLVDDLLDFSRAIHGKMKIELDTVDLRILVGDVVERFSDELKTKNISLNVAVEDGIFGRWDPTRIDQVFTNLISNAIKYGESTPIEISTKLRPGSVLISVRDRGAGIAEEDLDRVFDRFERVTHYASIPGMGLGLYISRKIVELHQGTIWAVSPKEGGSIFNVELPTLFNAASDLIHPPAPQIAENE